jgi:hypothetical protein
VAISRSRASTSSREIQAQWFKYWSERWKGGRRNNHKDLAGLCFVSYDPDVYHNPNAAELAPLPEAQKSNASSRYSGSRPELETRRRIATELFGTVEWSGDTEGYCACPGHHLHTTGDGERDCQLHLDNVPTLHCFHSSCAGICAGVNYETRKEL